MVSEIIQIKDSLLSQLMNDSIKDLQLHFDHETAMHRQERGDGLLESWTDSNNHSHPTADSAL